MRELIKNTQALIYNFLDITSLYSAIFIYIASAITYIFVGDSND